MVSEARKRANKTYSDKMDVIKTIKLNRKTDRDILGYLEKANVTNFTGLVKELIREQIKKEEEIKMKKVYEVEGREVEFEVGQVVNFGDLYDVTGEEEGLLESGSIAVYYNNGNDFDIIDFEIVTPAEPICDTKVRITDIHA